MKKSIAFIAAAILLAGCGPVTTADPIPQGDTETVTESSTQPKPKPKKKVSSCAQAREAFLTGSKADVNRALKRLKSDRKADGIAREYAGYYLGRDKNNKSLQEMDQSLIVSACL